MNDGLTWHILEESSLLSCVKQQGEEGGQEQERGEEAGWPGGGDGDAGGDDACDNDDGSDVDIVNDDDDVESSFEAQLTPK